MEEYYSFNLEKIREITNPIKELQGTLTNLKEIFEYFNENKNFLKDSNEKGYSEIQEINAKLSEIYRALVKRIENNLKNYLIFQNELIRKYKNSFKEKINNINFNKNDLTREIGLFLVKNQETNRIINKISVIYFLSFPKFKSIFKSLEYNTIFLSILHNTKNFFKTQKLKSIEERVEKITKEVVIEKQSKKSFEINDYQEYLKYSKEEFGRRRRREKRKSLEILKNGPEIKSEVSKVDSKKIEDFKSKLGTEFHEKYFIQNDDQQDPIDLIKKLKKNREEKYQEYLDKIKNKK